jgi:hypothetical protein
MSPGVTCNEYPYIHIVKSSTTTNMVVAAEISEQFGSPSVKNVNCALSLLE